MRPERATAVCAPGPFAVVACPSFLESSMEIFYSTAPLPVRVLTLVAGLEEDVSEEDP